MRVVRFTPAADRDMASIARTISLYNRAAALAVADRIEAALERLAQMPDMGHLRRDIQREGYRFWTVRPYLIVYRHDHESLTVVRVLHGRRDVARQLESSAPDDAGDRGA